MRNRYASLLGPDYSPAKVHVRATDTSRTIGSAQYTSAGIFAPPVETWKDATQYQSASIEIVAWKKDFELTQLLPCRKVDRLRADYLRSAPIQAKLNQYSKLRKYLERHSGSPARSVRDFFRFYDSMNTERMRGLP